MIRKNASLAAIVSSILTAILLSVLSSRDPMGALHSFIFSPLTNVYHLGNMLSYASLLLLTGGGVVLAFSSGSFNLGGEGQTYLAALITTIVLSYSVPLPLAFAAAAAAAGAMAGLSGLLRYRLGADELITSFLLSAATIPVVDYLISGPLRDRGSSLLATPFIRESARLSRILEPSQLSTVIILALAATVVLYVVLRYTIFGYEVRIIGQNRDLARYGGLPIGTLTILPLTLSGVWHGLAGAALVTGVHYRAITGFSGGLGWNGIAVALIARNNPALLIPAALLFSYLNTGSSTAVLEHQVTWEFGAILQAVVFLFVTAETLRRRKGRNPGGEST